MSCQDGRVLSNFINQALNNQDITVYGTGRQTRSFQYIDDLVEGMLKMMNTDISFTGPVNLGNPTEYTILEVAHKIIKLTDSNSRIIHLPLPSDDPKQRKPDIALAKQRLVWEPTVHLEKGLRRMVEYYVESYAVGGILV